jgi:hypothetical protein
MSAHPAGDDSPPAAAGDVSVPGVSVALPVHVDAGTLPAAFECIARQSLRSLDIMLVINGSDAPTREVARVLAAGEPRARVIELPEPNLAAALNAALEAARFPLVARMDADDWCPPGRLEAQARFMGARPGLAAAGCAWELADQRGRVITVVRPPVEPARLRWRLLLGNTLAHGSMMLRRESVLEIGGYDERCGRAQDYDLWLRLGGRIGCVPEVLYRHRARYPAQPGRSTPEQARVAAAAMVRAWRDLPPGRDEALPGLLEGALRAPGDASDEIEALARRLDEAGPSLERLLAYLVACSAAPAAPKRAYDAGRRAILRARGEALRSAGVRRVWLWGAGDHTRWLVEHAGELGLEIAGIVDDNHAGADMHGFGVGRPDALAPGDVALISSDWHEEAIWLASAGARARGVRVVRLYGDEPA